MSETTTPKRCEAVAFASNRQLEALDACREDEHNGTVEVWMRPTDTHAQPLYPASALEALQGEVQRLREVEATAKEMRLAFIFRQAVVATSETIEKIDFADNKVWKAAEKIKALTNLEPPTDGR